MEDREEIHLLLFSGGSTVITRHADIERFRIRCGPAHGVMLCQAAMWNPSIFRFDDLLPLSDVAKRFLQLVILFPCDFPANNKH